MSCVTYLFIASWNLYKIYLLLSSCVLILKWLSSGVRDQIQTLILHSLYTCTLFSRLLSKLLHAIALKKKKISLFTLTKNRRGWSKIFWLISYLGAYILHSSLDFLMSRSRCSQTVHNFHRASRASVLRLVGRQLWPNHCPSAPFSFCPLANSTSCKRLSPLPSPFAKLHLSSSSQKLQVSLSNSPQRGTRHALEADVSETTLFPRHCNFHQVYLLVLQGPQHNVWT